MRSLEDIIQTNNQEVAKHNPELLSNIWPIGQAVPAVSVEEKPAAKNRRTLAGQISFGTEVTIEFARAIGWNFKGLEQGLLAVLHAERNIPADESIPIDAFLTYIFALGAAPDLAEFWVSTLADAVAPYADRREPEFVIHDTTHNVLIKVADRCVVEVQPLKRQHE